MCSSVRQYLRKVNPTRFLDKIDEWCLYRQRYTSMCAVSAVYCENAIHSEYCADLNASAEGDAVYPFIAMPVGDDISIPVKLLPFRKRENKAPLVEEPALVLLIVLATDAGVLKVVVVAAVANAERKGLEEGWSKSLTKTSRIPLRNRNVPRAPSVLDEQGLTGRVDGSNAFV